VGVQVPLRAPFILWLILLLYVLQLVDEFSCFVAVGVTQKLLQGGSVGACSERLMAAPQIVDFGRDEGEGYTVGVRPDHHGLHRDAFPGGYFRSVLALQCHHDQGARIPALAGEKIESAFTDITNAVFCRRRAIPGERC
jgi:hypothetical protein